MTTKFIPRTITALVGIPVLIILIGWSPAWTFSLLIFFVTVVSLREYGWIVFPKQRRHRIVALVLGALVAVAVIDRDSRLAGQTLTALLAVMFAAVSLAARSGREKYRALGWLLLGALYIGYMVPHLVLLYELHSGKQWVFWLLLVVMTGDTAAYLIGSWVGKTKLCPTISPGKTVEGALASLGASVGFGLVGGNFLLPEMGRQELLWLSLGLSLLGQGGDLFESRLKRLFGVKDSGALLPGHGGLLDRIDSLIFPAVLTAHYVRLFHS